MWHSNLLCNEALMLRQREEQKMIHRVSFAVVVLIVLSFASLGKTDTTHTYNYSPTGSSMMSVWSLKNGGSYWSALFQGTLGDHSLRIDNIFDAYGETYPNWGAYVWNAPYYNEVIVRVRFYYNRDGYLGTFNPALFADSQAINSTGDAGTVSNVRWTLPGANNLNGTYEQVFDPSEGITSIGLGFTDTTSDTQNYVYFDQISIDTVRKSESSSQTPLVMDQYVQVSDGHFSYNGSRLRLWGINFVCNVKQTLADLPLSFERIADAGFNGVRLNLFSGTFLSGQTTDSWHVPTTVKGSDSSIDRLDCAIALAKERGMFFWLSFDLDQLRAGDYNILADNGTRTQWVALAASQSAKYLVYLDQRAAAAHIAYAKAILNHVNPYTGKRYADEETIGLCEIFNENSFLGNFSPTVLYPTLPDFVKNQINTKLNSWLLSKYGTNSALVTAWKVSGTSNMYSDETLNSSTVRFDFGPLNSGTRPKDMMQFTAWLYNDYNQRFISEVRAVGQTGKGIAVIPITPSGEFDFSLLRYYGAQMSGDFVSNGQYGLACRPWETSTTDAFYPFKSRLTSHPFFEQPVDLMRVKGKPYVFYEVNDYRPNPFGVEFPIRIAAQMSWQDGDAVFWFNWDDSGYLPRLSSDLSYTQARLPMPDSNYPNAGLILACDEVKLAAIRSAGTIFKKGLLPCATSPFEWTIGKNHLFAPNPASWNELEWWVRYYAWRQGVRVIFNPAVNSSSVPGIALGNSLNQGDYVRYDWNDTKPGTVQINAPAARAIVGFTGSSVDLGDLNISGINGTFSSIIVAAEDTLPLAQSKSILVTLTRNSVNTGYSFNIANLTGSGGLDDVVRALSAPGGNVGTSPVVVDRVSATFSAPWLAGMKYKKYDFARRCFAWGFVSGTNPTLTVSATEPLYYMKLIKTQMIPGDANDDGMVDVGDLGILAANYGAATQAGFMTGDFNADNVVDVGDLGILAANYGYGSANTANFNADAAALGLVTVNTDTQDDSSEADDPASLMGCNALGLPLIMGLLAFAVLGITGRQFS
jgi:hypothetical protein